MDNRYLFRGKRIDNGEWIVGSLIVDKQQDIETGEQIEIVGIYPSEYKDFSKRTDPSTICQCTGLVDMNGKLIWENDIVKDRDRRGIKSLLYKVVWDCEEGMWAAQSSRSKVSYCIGDANRNGYEVIGNAIDNPKLLESEDKEG